jgi:3-hydroxyacyl-CoA dehydrogenase
MTVRIKNAAVLGAAVMGAQIAAHFANAGLRVRLLDVPRDAALNGLERAKRLELQFPSTRPPSPLIRD